MSGLPCACKREAPASILPAGSCMTCQNAPHLRCAGLHRISCNAGCRLMVRPDNLHRDADRPPQADCCPQACQSIPLGAALGHAWMPGQGQGSSDDRHARTGCTCQLGARTVAWRPAHQVFDKVCAGHWVLAMACCCHGPGCMSSPASPTPAETLLGTSCRLTSGVCPLNDGCRVGMVTDGADQCSRMIRAPRSHRKQIKA